MGVVAVGFLKGGVLGDAQAVLIDGEVGEGVEDFLPLGGERVVEAELGVDVDEGLGGPAQQADGEVTVFIPGAGVFGRPGVWEVENPSTGAWANQLAGRAFCSMSQFK